MKKEILSFILMVCMLASFVGFTSKISAAENYADYNLLDWAPKGSSYWNSSAGSSLNTSAANAKYFISSKIFSKSEIPVGSIIVVDEGYQYRPEGWTALDAKTIKRPATVSTNTVIVNDSWWESFNYRAFNISKIEVNVDISNDVNEIASHFKIYVPKSAATVATPSPTANSVSVEELAKERIKNAVVLMLGSSDALVNNANKKIDSNPDVKPLEIEGRTLIPVRFVTENLNAVVNWDELTSTVTVNMDGKDIKFVIGSKVYTINGEFKELEVPAQTINSRTMIPLRAMVEAVGRKVFWDDRGLIVLSNTDQIFDSSKDKALLDFVISSFTTTIKDDIGANIKALKVLAIGNSFSQDATQWLYEIAKDCGIKEIVIGNLYIGGCSLATHWNNASSNNASYIYYKNSTGTWETNKGKTMLEGILDEDWDVITLQQVSGYSGVETTYNSDLDNLISYVNSKKTNSNAKITWHMTWAYQSNSTHADFAKYENNQMKMYQAIVNTVQHKIVSNSAFSFAIPSGTAIQNVRSSFVGDTLTRDGYHLSYNLGRYIAGLTWFRAITGLSIENVKFVPDNEDIPGTYMPLIKEAVNAAIEKPFAITQSSFTTAPKAVSTTDINFDNYILLDWAPKGAAYWNSPAGSSLITSASNAKYFVSSKIFSKSEIPVGSIIVVDEGYQYRPEGWTAIDTKTTARPSVVTKNIVTVTESWWGSYNYRAFNISKTGGSIDISNAVQETASHFRIYVPKSEASK